MNKCNCYISLNELVEVEIKETQALNKLLQQEKDLLPKESDLLITISKSKHIIIKSLDAYNNKLNALVQTCGFTPGRDGIESCIAWCDHKNTLRNQWNKLVASIKKCQTLNTLNGSVVDNSLRAVKHALTVLYGQPEAQKTYNANGQEEHQGFGREIAKV